MPGSWPRHATTPRSPSASPTTSRASASCTRGCASVVASSRRLRARRPSSSTRCARSAARSSGASPRSRSSAGAPRSTTPRRGSASRPRSSGCAPSTTSSPRSHSTRPRPPHPKAPRSPDARRDLERELRIMGPINPLALEEHDALQERHQFLQEQLEDVKAQPSRAGTRHQGRRPRDRHDLQRRVRRREPALHRPLRHAVPRRRRAGSCSPIPTTR